MGIAQYAKIDVRRDMRALWSAFCLAGGHGSLLHWGCCWVTQATLSRRRRLRPSRLLPTEYVLNLLIKKGVNMDFSQPRFFQPNQTRPRTSSVFV